MQISNPNPSPNAIPSFSAALEQAFARAVARLADILPPPFIDPVAPVDEPPAAVPTVERLLTGPELFRVLREPTEWLLALAHRLAIDDPVDLAAVHRVRAALLARFSGRPASLRATDVLTVFGLLIGALSPAVVIRAVSSTLSDELAAVLGSELPVSVYVATTPDPRRESQLGRTSHACCPLHAR